MVFSICVVADDLGYSSTRDNGIFATWRAGGISCASLLVNGMTAESAARRAHAEGLTLGLHLNLTEGRACSDSPTLHHPDGMLLGKFGFVDACLAGRISAEDIKRESSAQLQRFVMLTGQAPRFANGHNHVHALMPVAEVLAGLWADAGVSAVRIPEGIAMMKSDYLCLPAQSTRWTPSSCPSSCSACMPMLPR
jgi:predicted glycoside hydrolase/deacetylase ChbG (UPF0249 family)